MNTKQIMTALLSVITLAAINACQKEADNPVVKSFNVSGFTKVTAGDDHEIIITNGTSFSVQAKGADDDVKELRVEVTGENLKIDYPVYRNQRKRLHITITMPVISSFDFGGAAYGSVKGFQLAGIIANLSGATKFNLDADVNELTVFTSGAAKLTAAGSAEKVTAEASGQSEYRGYAVTGTDEAVIKTSGQAEAYLNVSHTFEADASGQSRIYYKGNPSAKNITQSGQAKVVNE